MNNKIVLIVFSGLGGVQSGPNMLTELQQAHIPNMDALMRRSVSGLIWPTEKGKIPNPEKSLESLLGTCPVSPKCALVENGTDQALFKKMGFTVLKSPSDEEMVNQLENNFSKFDFFILHIKKTKEFGLLGEYYLKIIELEQFDKQMQRIQALNPNVLVITGDYSVPTELQKITWHPVPLLLHSQFCRYDDVMLFDEISCRNGGLGHLYPRELMPIILANIENKDGQI
jgi:2,3-bisphosphoglycerate-independent phosphoglycerate mutase